MVIWSYNENYIRCYNLNLTQKNNLYNYMSTFVQKKEQETTKIQSSSLNTNFDYSTIRETHSAINLLIGKKCNCVKVHTNIKGLTKFK